MIIMKQSSSPKSQTALLVLLGAAIGAVLGLLFAPESGKITRTKLRNLFRNSGNQAQD
jgi:gas vesicle protein